MRIRTLLVLAISAIGSNPCWADDGWLLVSKDGRQSLVYATPTSFLPVASLGNVTIYTNVGSKIGLVTRDSALRAGSLLIVDKATRSIDVTWPVYVIPATQLLGPSEDLLLLDGHAYFVGVRFDLLGQPLEPNTLGGHFDLHRVSLRLGTVESFPLPREIANPRIVGVDGKLVISSFSKKGSNTWTFDEATRSVQLIGGKIRAQFAKMSVESGIPDPNDGRLRKAIPGTIKYLGDASCVFVDYDGVIRKVSASGESTALWDLNVQLPGTTPSLARVIELY